METASTLKIHWLVQAAPGEPGFLSAGEQARFSALRNEKRRREWLLGRWTAKRLLQAYLWFASGLLLPMSDLAIENDYRRVPYGVALLPVGWQPLSVSLTISHSHDHALSAIIAGDRWVLGGDIERIEARSAAFIEAYFTPGEAAQVQQASEDLQPVLATAIWSGKESVLKSLHLGLSVDTRSVTCRFGPPVDRPASWAPFTLQTDVTRLPGYPGDMVGWWRVIGPFVLTLALRRAW